MQELSDKNNFLEVDNIGISLLKHNPEFKNNQGVGMAWNACACHDLKYFEHALAWHVWIDHDFGCVNVSWLRVYEHVMALVRGD